MSNATELEIEGLLALSSTALYELEQTGEAAREVLDARIVEWAKGGQTQRWMADEIGCSHVAVSNRLARLGVKTEAAERGHGGARVGNPVTKSSDNVVPIRPTTVEQERDKGLVLDTRPGGFQAAVTDLEKDARTLGMLRSPSQLALLSDTDKVEISRALRWIADEVEATINALGGVE